MGKLKYWLPAGLFLALAMVLAMGLTLDPRKVPSPLVGKPAPAFQLAQLWEPDTEFSPQDMQGKVWVLNVWASWCVGCREEHEVLQQLADEELVPIVGLNYKDKPENAKKWLGELGDFFALSVMDRDGRAGIDWGVYGVPETFIIDHRGIIRYKHIGPMDYPALTETVIPTIKSLIERS